ncbi:MAG: hypothetical protein R2788_18240 [Saprospiraceae bacterium]
MRVSDIAGRVIFEKTRGVDGHRFELDISKNGGLVFTWYRWKKQVEI